MVYIDRGISHGMEYGIQRAITDGRDIVFRSLPEFASNLTIEQCYEKYLY